MPQRPRTRTVGAAGAAVASLAAAVYANDRYGFTSDIKQLLRDRAFNKRLESRTAQVGDHATIYHLLGLADRSAPALWFEGRTWTYSEVLLEVDKLATILHQRGIGNGDFVAVFMTNSAEMVFAFIALTKLGAVPALINSALRNQTLAHCMKVANAKLIICTPDLAPFVLDLFSEIGALAPCISLNLLSFPASVLPSDNPYTSEIRQVRYEDLATVLVNQPSTPARRTLRDVGCLIYTSGTSGKPKAVSIKNFLLIVVATTTSHDADNRKRYFPLRTYSCLPLFHATCLFTGLYYSVGNSSTFCLVRKFSASKFSEQLTASGATRMLYVGELCRYLLKAPVSKYDQAHKCIVASGNGLQKDVWNKFRDRYNIPEIREFYRSTEGVAKFDNFTRDASAAGYVGHAGLIGRYREDVTYLVKYDPTTEAPWRDPKTGFCVPVALEEPGEAIGRVRSLDFYSEYLNNAEANQDKLIKDVFEKGDLFQRTGDLLMRDKKGWIRFVDRSGDTYRWRGENVSAGEVREHISRLPNVHDVTVYGVKLDGYDGQAGAAGITLLDASPAAEAAFCQNLYSSLRKQGLTVYQIPRLVRITKQIETGATFKHAKDVLKGRSWDPVAEKQEDSLYWLNGEVYTRLDSKSWREIVGGRAKL